MFPKEFLNQIAQNYSLSEKQKDVFLAKYGGDKNDFEIATNLYISEDAVRVRMTGIYNKFHIRGKGSGKYGQLLKFLTNEFQKYTPSQVSKSDVSKHHFSVQNELHSPTPLQPEEAEESKKMSNQTINTSAQIEINSIRECFSKAIDHLGSEKLHVRIGAIYSLERIANDSSADYWRIIEYLAAFIKVNTEQMQPEGFYNSMISLDIQTALTVIGRRNFKQDPPNATLNLTHIDIQGANLSGAYLRRVNLYKANLQRCILFGANLQQANLPVVNLKGALLDGANLEEAWLDEANLQGADLSGLLNETNPNANFKGAIILKADIRRTNFSGVRHLELSQVKSARGDDTTCLPEYLNPYQEEILKHWKEYQ
ncbi:pentapeptide repeat-containing protein [Floridanema aerugineum]|uniref:Pentapeptide repeat-containing protein n=1 Tax=Floridaenema aerugineum BLCC-F46 TaxID=3153654 RepID=A0ABV4X3V9_9CYAN